MPKKSAYHHGDLRRVLIDASLGLIEEVGVAALSLREVARKAGVSHNAPYHHFVDKDALLTAIAIAGFDDLNRSLEAARASAVDPRARLQACGMAYVRFALRSPAFFRVMFRPELRSAADRAARARASQPALRILVDLVRACQEQGLWPPGDPMPIVLTCWSAAHGLASLWLDGPLQLHPEAFGKAPEKLAAMVAQTLGALFRPSPQRTRAPARPRRLA